MEHLVPVSKNGNNTALNKRPCCKRCNTWRGNMSLKKWAAIVQNHLDNKHLFRGYILYDYEIILENIDYWQHYIETSKHRLLKQKP